MHYGGNKMVRKLALLAAATAALSSCSLFEGQEADIPMIEQNIRTDVKEQLDISVGVDCPSEIEWVVNDTFNCIVEDLATGERGMAVVTMENDAGDLTWQMQ